MNIKGNQETREVTVFWWWLYIAFTHYSLSPSADRVRVISCDTHGTDWNRRISFSIVAIFHFVILVMLRVWILLLYKWSITKRAKKIMFHFKSKGTIALHFFQQQSFPLTTDLSEADVCHLTSRENLMQATTNTRFCRWSFAIPASFVCTGGRMKTSSHTETAQLGSTFTKSPKIQENRLFLSLPRKLKWFVRVFFSSAMRYVTWSNVTWIFLELTILKMIWLNLLWPNLT